MYCTGKETRRRARSGVVVVSFLFIDAQLMNSQWEGRKGVNEGGKQKLLFSSLFIVYTLIQQQQQQQQRKESEMLLHEETCSEEGESKERARVRNVHSTTAATQIEE